ncbi:hypothetical protein EON64_03020 [archaeon]|nr:MAG: hypothetical protein EON64_03020 [archaeon]
MITTADDLKDLLPIFPSVEFAFSYGSGAVQQGGYQYKKSASELPMLDIIMVVEDSEEWHRENMLRNPSHYSPLVPMNYFQVAWVQEKVPANFWFNAYVPIPTGPQAGRLLKYGVISKKHALKDLLHWNNLYLAGRLHKPVHILKSSADFDSALQTNREHVMRTALLLLPDKFTEIDLYIAVASLSYVGDPRMILGENPRKVVNLVAPIVPTYRHLYTPTLEYIGQHAQVTKMNAFSGAYTQNVAQSVRWQMCLDLPSSLRSLLSLR